MLFFDPILNPNPTPSMACVKCENTDMTGVRKPESHIRRLLQT